MKIVFRVLFALALLTPLLSSAATLRAYSSVGDSAAVVANCIYGTNPYGSDVRGCSNDSGDINNATSSTVANTASQASYSAPAASAQAYASGTLGTLHAYADASIPSADASGHNLQSHAYVEMTDNLQASSSLGALYSNYTYTIAVTGSSTPYSQYGSAPSTNAYGFAQLDIRDATNGTVYASKYLDLNSDTPNGTITGTVSVTPGTMLRLDLVLEVAAGVGTNAVGQSAFAQADYKDTVHFYLDALTPGANTVGTSGYDYTTPAVPLPAPFALMSSALGLLGVIARHKKK